MIKLFIVDDESIIRKGLRFFIDWEKHNVEVIGEASNGHEALQSIVKQQPDIVLTDIKMPKMNGLEFVLEVKKIMPEIKIIMLSGHSDTEYFTKAISLGVSEYILKSADSAEVVSAVERVSHQIFIERQKALQTREISQLFDDNYQHLASRYMTDLLEDPNTDIVKRNIADMKIDISGPFYALIYIGNAQTREEQRTIMSMLHFSLSFYSPLITCINTSIICLINYKEQQVADSLYMDITDRLATKHLPIIVSNGFSNLGSVKLLYQRATEIRLRSCWYPDAKLLHIQEVQLSATELSVFLDFEKQIVTSLEKNSSAATVQKLRDYFEFLASNVVPMDCLMESMKRMIACICYYRHDYHNIAEYSQLIDQSHMAYEIFELVVALIDKNNQAEPQSAIVRRSIEIIEEGYAEKLTLALLAKKVFVSTSYLSKVFSDEVGIGVKQYINKVRIEKSKELIKIDKLKVFEIADAVGFRDYKQFATYFHRFEGMSITEYRRSIM